MCAGPQRKPVSTVWAYPGQINAINKYLNK